jgi:hypothetical protein
MTTSPDATVSRAYRRRLAELRDSVTRRALAEYAIDESAIAASFEAYAARIAPILESGQASIQRLADAFLRTAAFRSLGERVEPDPAPIVGTTQHGATLLEGMAAWGPMVLGQIAGGRSTAEALDYGRFLVERFSDAELTATADRELAHQATSGRLRIVAWDGVVSPGSCDPCQANAGRHDRLWVPYRHGGCNCDQVPVFA